MVLSTRMMRLKMRWRYGWLCLLLALSILLGLPLREEGLGTLLFGALIPLILYAAASAAGITPSRRRLYMGLATPVILIDAWIAVRGGSNQLAVLASCCHVAFMALTAVSILSHIFIGERVTLDTILGGILVYLVIGVTFGYLYGMLELSEPGSFVELGKVPHAPINAGHLVERRPELTYFSFMTLTTVGYGDIVPIRPLARVLAMLEALVGQIFLATFLAFLVGNYLVQSQSERRREETLQAAKALVDSPTVRAMVPGNGHEDS